MQRSMHRRPYEGGSMLPAQTFQERGTADARRDERRSAHPVRVADLPEIEAPVMLLVGTEEPFAEQAREAAELLPRGTYVPLEGLDHVQAFFRSDLVLPYVQEFLARTNM